MALLGLAPVALAQPTPIDWPALLQQAEQAARQVGDEQTRRELLIQIAVVHIVGRQDGANRLIEETRQPDGKCAGAVAAAFAFAWGSDPRCRDNAKGFAEKLEKGDFSGAFGEYSDFKERRDRLQFLGAIALWLVSRDRVDGVAAIAAVPTDNITKDDFHRLVAWHAGRFGKIDMARAAIAQVQSKTAKFAAWTDLVMQLALMGRQQQSRALFDAAVAELNPGQQVAAFIGANSMVAQERSSSYLPEFSARPFLALIAAQRRFGAISYLLEVQTRHGDLAGMKASVAFIERVVAHGDFAGEDQPWPNILEELLAMQSRLGDAAGTDRTMAALQRWLDVNQTDRYYDERRLLVDWIAAWEIAKRERAAGSGIAKIRGELAAAPLRLRALAMARSINENGGTAVREILALERQPRRDADILEALFYALPGAAHIDGVVAAVIGTNAEHAHREVWAEETALIFLRHGEPAQARLLLPILRATSRPYVRALGQVLIVLGEIDAARAAAARCKASTKISPECEQGLEFLAAALAAKRFDLALAEIGGIVDPAVRAGAVIRILQADWSERFPAAGN